MRIARIVRRRRRRAPRGGRMSRPAGVLLLILGGGLCAAAAWILLSPLPLPAPDLELGAPPRGAQFYDRTGKLLVEAGSARALDRRWYGLEDAPADDCVLAAFLAARGLSREDIAKADVSDGVRAMADALTGADDLAGEAAGELIAMRGGAGGLWGKARLAGALSARYPPLSLAEWLLNVRLYGRGAVGVDDAALTYFDVHAGGMTPAQCAAAEALAQDPQLGGNAAGWKTASNGILNSMLNAGFLEKTAWQRAVNEAVSPVPSIPTDADSVFGGRLPILDSYLQLAVDRLGGRYPQEELPRAGIRVYTAMDFDLEMQLVCAAQNLLAPAGETSAVLPTLEGKPCDMAALLGPGTEENPPEDLALALVDPVGGEVLAYFDSARGDESAARGAAGTALLPFVYLAAFARGFSPASMLLDIPRSDLADDPGREYLGPVSARTALQRRATAAAAGMAAGVGLDQVARTLALLGLGGDAAADSSLDNLMDQQTDLLSLTQAYATLAGSGLETSDVGSGSMAAILRVEQADGRTLDEFSRRESRRIFDAGLAFLVQDILSEPSGRPDLSSPALAGSRSTVAAMAAGDLQGNGAWAFAFTPAFAVGIRSRPYASENADYRAAWLLAQAAAGWALRALPLQLWSEPAGIVRRDVCVPSGMLPSRYCPNVASEVFLEGNEPVQTDTYYRPVAVNRESGRLATLWTPLELVDEQIFFVMEGEGRIWAERSGFPLPPDTYDTLPDTFPYYDGLHITLPAPLSTLRGKIALRGTAAIPEMDRFILQAGPGLYPSIWYTLGTGNGPVREGVLGEWDTSGTDGVWSLQLTAVLPGGKILAVAVPVTLDNSPPALRWIYPATPKTITVQKGEAVILQVEVTDNLGTGWVDFFLDGKVRTRLEVGPYSVRWSDLAPGGHTVWICAYDQAGNESCTQEMQVEVGLKTSGGFIYNTPGKVKI
jgi:hypothetical protein